MEKQHIISSDIQNSYGSLPGLLKYLWEASCPTADTSNRIPVLKGSHAWVQKTELPQSDQSASLQYKETILNKVLHPALIDKRATNLRLNFNVAFRLKTIPQMKN